MHVLLSPLGEPLSYHRTLGQVFDALDDLDQDAAVLASDDWEVLVFLDRAGNLLVTPEV